MYKSTQQPNAERLDIPTNVEDQNNSTSSKKLIERWEWEKSGIWITKTEEGYFAAIGNNKITDTYQNREDIEAKLIDKDWDLLLLAIAVIASKIGDEIENKVWMKIEDKLNQERARISGL